MPSQLPFKDRVDGWLVCGKADSSGEGLDKGLLGTYETNRLVDDEG